ncbi:MULTISPECIES: hypothetical protein [unclassified Nocardiopsis]|uniref:hypothetical protein n=1 Tax=unclassified Nocardiopsis TaxID=2649073 RepID=UPI00135B1217|nr:MULTISPECIES: hypothetical protein [unclassified Nocardiopsis]
MPINQAGSWGRAVSAALLAFSVLSLSACEDEGTDAEDVQEEEGVGVGHRVTVSSQVTEVLSDQAFAMEGDDDPAQDEPLLVVTADPTDVSEGDTVTVTGTIQEFDYRSYLEDYALEDEGLYQDFEGDQFIVADEVLRDASPGTG